MKDAADDHALPVASVPAAPAPTRLRSLDGLRGLAALWVVLHHCCAASAYLLASAPIVRFTPLRLFLGARPPVIFFFVLSGFVLALPYGRGAGPEYVPFLTQRFCRIYLPFAATVLLSAAGCVLLATGPLPDTTPFLNAIWRGVSPDVIAKHLLMTGIDGETDLVKPMWSLVQEMRVSIVFPFLVMVATAAGWRRMALIAAGLFVAAWLSLYSIGQDRIGYYAAVSPAASAVLSVFFLLPFIVGILLAIDRERMTTLLSEAGTATRVALWIAVGLVLATPSLSAGLDAVYSLGGGLLILLTLGTPAAERVLARRPLQWLGRVSYSLYLIHVPILAATLYLLQQKVPVNGIIAATPLASLLGAAVFHRLVEAPSIELGRKLAGRIRDRRLARYPWTTSSGGSRDRLATMPIRGSFDGRDAPPSVPPSR